MPKKSSNSFSLMTAPERTIQVQHYRSENPRKLVIMAPAMAVPHSYYREFCQWLTTQGYDVLGFDYYGIGASQPGSLRKIDSSITDWARFDAQCVLNYALDNFPALPTVWFAHSIGGQIFGMLERHDEVERMVTVATGTGYWRETQTGLKYKSWLLWRGIVPWLLPLVGYFPGERLGIVGNVPRSAMAQWRQWCLHPDYLVGAEQLYERYAGVETPIISLAFSDDELLTRRNITAMHDFYRNAPQRREFVTPADCGVARIGHFALFRPRAQQLWQQLLAPQINAALPVADTALASATPDAG
ncbi:serine aminopeptidase domain-containing protein [Pseudidiomarina insulisalsae]|uniref:Alpha/beta hydrolase n=1 Tax=Pseudidiomarina insulisalsae TaxID=575789 RepID=A0A432YC64_9GAMM|nr:alpha/beta hydrolase [Pseudidiomarina insulisalsae]RUO58598.1 alpha/beta hydrolase [Pseudidiomarina insulisalsae]